MNADANVMDYSYSVLDVPFRKALQGMFNKAVRVTTAVKEKIGNGFRKNFTVKGIEEKQVDLVNKFTESNSMKPVAPVEEQKPVLESTTSTPAEEEKFLVSKSVDETIENLGVLVDKLNALERQKKVIAAIKRVALYTKELAELTARVTKKWFGRVEKADSPANAAEAVVAPVVSAIKAPEPVVMPIAPVEEPKKELKPEPVSVPTFDWNSIIGGIQTPSVEKTVESTPVNNFDNSVINTVTSFELPDFGMNVETQEKVVEPTMKVEKPKESPMITRYRVVGKTPKSNVLPFVKKEEKSSFNVEETKDELPTRGAIAARIYRLSEYIKELTAEERKLRAELDTAKAATAAANDKVAAYDKVNSSLAEKIHIFTEQVTSLKADLEQARAARLEAIKNNEEKIAMMKADYEMQLSKASDEMGAIRAEYERKLADANAKRSEEIARINAEYKQTMLDIYSGMQNIQATDEMPLANSQSEETNPFDIGEAYSYEFPQKQIAA